MKAIRLTFNVIGGEPVYESVMQLNMRVPPQQRINNMETCAGLWIEVRDANCNPIYRRAIDAEALQPDTTVRTGTSDRPYVRVASENITRRFNVVIPDDPRGESFHIFERRVGSRDTEPTERVHLVIRDLF